MSNSIPADPSVRPTRHDFQKWDLGREAAFDVYAMDAGAGIAIGDWCGIMVVFDGGRLMPVSW
jgi:hypothetical protein